MCPTTHRPVNTNMMKLKSCFCTNKQQLEFLTTGRSAASTSCEPCLTLDVMTAENPNIAQAKRRGLGWQPQIPQYGHKNAPNSMMPRYPPMNDGLPTKPCPVLSLYNSSQVIRSHVGSQWPPGSWPTATSEANALPCTYPREMVHSKFPAGSVTAADLEMLMQ